VQARLDAGASVLVQCIYAAFRDLLALFLQTVRGIAVTTKQSVDGKVSSFVFDQFSAKNQTPKCCSNAKVLLFFQPINFDPEKKLPCQVAVLTARQARGSQCHTVVACLFRRYDFDKDFVAHARDPGKVAVMISRATHELILFHERTRDDDFIGRLQNFLWHSRWTRGYSYETLNVDEQHQWTPDEHAAWQWQEDEPWKAALSDSDSDEDLHFAEIFSDPAMRTLCELREHERQVRRATLPRYRPSSDVPADLWYHVQHLVFAKAVKAEQFDNEDSEEADEAADVKISAVISLPMLPCNVRLFRSFRNRGEMWDSVPTALAAQISSRLEGSTISVQYHKAEVSYHVQHVLVAQRCRSFRPEAQIHHGGEMVAKIYFGMGTQANHWSSYNLVCFVFRTAALRAAQQELGAVDRWLGNVPER